MRLLILTVFATLILQSVPFCLSLKAQQYFVRLDILDSRCKLYMGYQNVLWMPLIHLHDTINRYIFHAKAVGADIDYDQDGKMTVLPYEKYGHVDVYAEMKGEFYYAGQFKFEGVAPPSSPLQDGSFVAAMGITKENPRNTLPTKKNFDLNNKLIKKMSGLEIEGFRSMYLEKDQVNHVRIKIYLKENDQYIEQLGKIDVLSVDAKVRKVNNGTFQITLPPRAHRCRLAIYLNDVKIEEEVVTSD